MMNIRFNDKKDKSLNNRINTVLLLPSTKLANKLQKLNNTIFNSETNSCNTKNRRERKIRILIKKVNLLKDLKVLVNSLIRFIRSRFKKCNRKIYIIKNIIYKNKIFFLNLIINLMFFIISCWKKESRGFFSFQILKTRVQLVWIKFKQMI